ncbi:MAG TPA: lysophospholipid acyltransferase family protein [Acidimicrobiales bacterium]|nr:lysophospholipid acyltransferase family protein [Acidimicrobiales bacterium]
MSALPRSGGPVLNNDEGPPFELPSRGSLLWYQFARGLLFIPAWLFWRPILLGQENLPATTPYVIAPVHRSYVDTVLTAYITRRRVRFMAKSGVFAKPWVARLFSSLGGFPVRRGTPDREALHNAEEAIAVGEPVVLYPEGRRSSGPVLDPLMRGPAFVALRAGVPIVPVGIGGTERSMPIGAKWVSPVRVAIVIGKPIWPPPRPGSERVPRRMVEELTERLREELQSVFDQARVLAGD